ncbi:23S rRNA (uracil(1939)-C(5))-methyltransferase RlmD, partial [Listeria monocytogenes]|nr:23S rRNA (uracil(1939)-C(5))-methyltransferase RlmD [Listeria monocytogenes]
CGGCQLQHVAYSAQLELKRDIVIQSIEKHTKIDPTKLKIRPTIGMEDPWRYRNKSQFQTRMVGSGQVETGLFGANSHQLVPIEDCIVQQPVTIKVTNFVRDLLEKYGVPIYDEKAGSGIVRTIVVRTGVKTGETQLVFITNSKKLPKKREMLAEIEAALPEVTSIMQNVNQAKSSLIFGDETFLLAGKESIEEKLMELEFDLSARAFFQLNPFQTERLYQEVEKALVLTGSETLVDAYCGVGTIGQAFAGIVKEVRGMDIIPESIEDAKRNAEKNGIENVYYEVGKAEDVLPKWVKEGFRPDAVIVDPPRSGCDQGLIKSLLDVEAKQLVYVSCNPSTLARDLALLAKKYRIRYMQPVDMFPQTAHVETVVLLQLKDK